MKTKLLLTLAMLMSIGYTQTSAYRDGQPSYERWGSEPVGDKNLYPIDPVVDGKKQWQTPTVLTLAEMQQSVLNNFANYIRYNAYSRSIDQETLFAIVQNIFTNPKLKLSNSTIEATTYLMGQIYHLFRNGLTSPDKMQTFLKDLSDQMSAVLELQAKQPPVNETWSKHESGPQGGVRRPAYYDRDRNPNGSPKSHAVSMIPGSFNQPE